MNWLLPLTLFHSAVAPSTTNVATIIELTILPRVDRLGQWCSGAAFEEKVRNPGPRVVWLDLGKPADEADVSSYSLRYERRLGNGRSEISNGGAYYGRTDDWRDIEFFRSSGATMLRPGESATRIAKPDDVHLWASQLTVELAIRIHGTQDLNGSRVDTYEPRATLSVRLRRRGSCFEVRRLTSR